jgi:Flp pilus assembly protein TadB
MREILLFSGLLLLGLGVVASVWRSARSRALARGRMEHSAEVSGPALAEPIPVARSFLVRRRLLPWMVGLFVAGFLYVALGWAAAFVIAIGLIVSLLGGQLESYLAARRTARIETQLADAIDLMVAALGAGAGVADALENAMAESRRPLRPQLEEVVGRIRFGDDPRTVYHALTQRVPLETFLLFSSALSVQAETGGSLAPTLASVGRTIRDRIEIARRIRSNSAQSEVSTLAVMMLTYFIALVVWRTNPQQMNEFLATSIGKGAVAGTILLQAVGLVWMAFLSRLRF